MGVLGTMIQDIKENQVMVYMKGVPEAPQCGFSAMVVRILDEYGKDTNSHQFLMYMNSQGVKCGIYIEVVCG